MAGDEIRLNEMRIMFAVHTYYPARNGVQMVTQYMAEGLALRHDVLVITELKEGNGTEKRAEFAGVRIERIRVRRKGYRFIGDRDVLLRRIIDWSPDILISVCTQSWPFDWLWGELEKLPCHKVLYTHGYSGLMEKWPLWEDLTHMRLHAFLYHAYWKWYYDRAYRYIAQYDLVTYLSEDDAACVYGRAHGLTNGSVLCNAVEDMFFEAAELKDRTAERGQEYGDGLVRFICVSNYDENKNQEMILDSFQKARLKQAKLTFIGSSENEYYRKLVAIAQQMPEGSVTFLTGIDRTEIPLHLARADVYICGSRKETYGMALCEAAAVGLPVISTPVGIAPQMEGCLIVHSVNEMSEAIRLLSISSQERMIRGRKLRSYAQAHYRVQDKIEWMEERLMQLAASK